MKEHENFILKISDEKKREIQEDAQKMLEPIIPYLQDFFTKHERFVSAYKGISFHKLLIGKEQGDEVVETYNDLALFMDFRNDNGYFTVLKNKKWKRKTEL